MQQEDEETTVHEKLLKGERWNELIPKIQRLW